MEYQNGSNEHSFVRKGNPGASMETTCYPRTARVRDWNRRKHETLVGPGMSKSWSVAETFEASPNLGTSTIAHRRSDIQGLRAIAVLLVVAFHAGLPVPGGFVGVDIFFVISGFVITSLLVRELTRTGRINLRHFYRRRVRRLFPALAVVVSVTVLFAAVLQSPVSDEVGGPELTAMTGLGGLFFAANAVLYRVPIDGYFADRATNNPLLHIWSLSVEEQFYVFFPLLLMAVMVYATRKGRRPVATLFVVTSSVGLLSLLACVLFTYELVGIPGVSSVRSFAFYFPVTRAWEFGFGALVALAAGRIVRWHPRLLNFLGVAGLVGIVLSALFISDASSFPGIVALGPVASTALVIMAGLSNSGGPVTRLLGTRPLTAVGDVSYSLYLWHWPSIVFAGILFPQFNGKELLGALISFGPAILVYRVIEDPIRRGVYGKLTTKRIIAASLVPPALLSVFLLVGARTGWGQPDVDGLQRTVVSESLVVRAGCFLGGDAASRDVFDRCRWSVPNSRGTILLVGDSHAESLSNAVIDAGNAMGYDVVAVTGGSCAFVGPVPGLATTVPNCVELSKWRGDFAMTGDVELVVTTQATAGSIQRLESFGHINPAERWVEANLEVLSPLDHAKVPLLYIGDVPTVGVNGSPCWYGAVVGTRCSASRSLVEHRQARGFAAEREIASGLPNLTYWSPVDRLCDGQTCRSSEDGRALYRDAEHLTPFGADVLRPDIQRLMTGILSLKGVD